MTPEDSSDTVYVMSHDLQIQNGKASFAYNQRVGDPWHRLGVPVDGNMTIPQALQASRADFTVEKLPLLAREPSGLVYVPQRVATVATYTDGTKASLGVVGEGYQVVQNEAALEVAYSIVGASNGDAQVDTIGVLSGGAQLFSYLALDGLVIDPTGINDEIDRGLVIYWSHDGSVAMTYLFSAIRVVCRNTLSLALSGAKNVFRAKHTASVEKRLEGAQAVLGVSTQWASAFSKKAEELLKVSYTEDKFQKLLTQVFPEPHGATDRQKSNVKAIRTQVRGIFANERNSKNYGSNGWSMYNSIVEYLDHERDSSQEDLWKATMTPGSWVDKKKIEAASRILELA